MGNAVVWQAIMGRHADSLRDFFGQLLAGRAGAAGPGRAAAGFHARPGLDGRRDPTPVRDLDAALAFAERLGGRVERSCGSTPGERRAVVCGPGGERVVLRSAD
ncbi:MAG: VOC family protein [Myxococcota bacterium]